MNTIPHKLTPAEHEGGNVIAWAGFVLNSAITRAHNPGMNPITWLRVQVESGSVHWSIAILSGVAIPALVVWIVFEFGRLLFG